LFHLLVVALLALLLRLPVQMLPALLDLDTLGRQPQDLDHHLLLPYLFDNL
jgi:hypothetical protein